MTTWVHKAAEQRGIPLRTLEQVRVDLTDAKARDADEAMARLMLRHGRLTNEARKYVAREYPQ
jgi:predicted deacylase